MKPRNVLKKLAETHPELTVQHLLVLTTIYDRGDARVKDLTKAPRMSQSSVSRAVLRLVSAKLVEREKLGPTNLNGVSVKLSLGGRDFLRGIGL